MKLLLGGHSCVHHGFSEPMTLGFGDGESQILPLWTPQALFHLSEPEVLKLSYAPQLAEKLLKISPPRPDSGLLKPTLRRPGEKAPPLRPRMGHLEKLWFGEPPQDQ